MINAMRKVPAGTFLIPMIISMLIYSFWPTLFKIGVHQKLSSLMLGLTILLVYSCLLPERLSI